MTTMRFFLCGSWTEGMVHFSKIRTYIDSLKPGQLSARVVRTKLGFPLLIKPTIPANSFQPIVQGAQEYLGTQGDSHIQGDSRLQGTQHSQDAQPTLGDLGVGTCEAIFSTAQTTAGRVSERASGQDSGQVAEQVSEGASGRVAGQVSGQVAEVRVSDSLLAILDEFHGVNHQEPEKGLHTREISKVSLECGAEVEAWIYFANPKKLPPKIDEIEDGNWQKSLAEKPPLIETMSEKQVSYVKKLGSANGRDIIPINDLTLYRELMNLELIVDKGRRLALSKLGQEVYRSLV